MLNVLVMGKNVPAIIESIIRFSNKEDVKIFSLSEAEHPLKINVVDSFTDLPTDNDLLVLNDVSLIQSNWLENISKAQTSHSDWGMINGIAVRRQFSGLYAFYAGVNEDCSNKIGWVGSLIKLFVESEQPFVPIIGTLIKSKLLPVILGKMELAMVHPAIIKDDVLNAGLKFGYYPQLMFKEVL